MFIKLAAAYRAWERRFDLKVLWPHIKMLCEGDIDNARDVFLVHMEMDRAWTRDLSWDERVKLVGALT